MEMLQKAFDLHRNGLTELAEEIYLEVLKKEPENYAALNLYGILLAQKNSKEQALLLLEKACQLQPKDAIFRFNKGNIQME
ncbi:MAG: tetratricopeptide repeat protein, partial [Crocinitomicaceae bacterium]|nr:tetratricopeptide repeat protein [Crocinitomicaceae bacterium]